jgi:glycosyltransferase involved in cell wall biosynthesis
VRIAFAHHEPIDAARARWVAIVRTLAAVAERAPVAWLTPDTSDAVRAYADGHLGLTLPLGLEIVSLPSLHRRMGVTVNHLFFRACRRVLPRCEPDVVWLRGDKLAAHLARRGAGAPLVYEAHLVGELWARDRGASERNARRLHDIEQRVYRAASGVAAITGGLLQEIRARFDYQGPAAVVPSGVDTKLFRPVWDGGDGRTVAYVGTLQFWKGLDTLLDALVEAPELRLLVLGGGKAEELARLRARVDHLGLRDRVELAGRVPQREIPSLLAHVACAVHPLREDHAIAGVFTSPLKLFEYMALGLPIVAGGVGSVREILRDGETARLYAPGDARALAAALREVCGDSALAARLGSAAAKESAHFSYEARAQRLLDLFQDTLGSH